MAPLLEPIPIIATVPACPKLRLSCLIASLPRSGSWLLADALHTTGLVGQPEEYFRPDYYDWWLREWGVRELADYGDYISEAQRYSTTDNGVFSAKVHWYQFEWLLAQLRRLPGKEGPTDSELIERYFPRPTYVLLTRDDKARQAVSYYRAIHSEEWFVLRNISLPRTRAIPAVPDFQEIRWLEDVIVNHEARWKNYFAASSLLPLRVRYEDLAQQYEKVIDEVLDYLRIDRPRGFVFPTPNLVKQADDQSEQLVDAYRARRDQLLPLTDEIRWCREKQNFERPRHSNS